MLMSVTTENAPIQGQTTLQENRAGEGVYASLFEKLIHPGVSARGYQRLSDDAVASEVPAAERLTAAMQAGGTHPSVRSWVSARQNAD